LESFPFKLTMKMFALLSVCVLAAAEEIETGESESLSLLQTAAQVQSHHFGIDEQECEDAKADTQAAKAALKLARTTFKSQKKAAKADITAAKAALKLALEAFKAQKAALRAAKDAIKDTQVAEDDACFEKFKCGKKGDLFLTGCATWKHARKACTDKEGDLVMVKDAATDAKVVAWAKKAVEAAATFCNDAPMWIGGNCPQLQPCAWIDGSTEPWQKNALPHGNNQNINLADGRWSTADDKRSAVGICECR